MIIPSPQEPPLLQARDLTKVFPGARALSRVDLTLRRGEVLAVIGENGAGKSTLMRILAGVIPADSGEIRLDGRPVAVESVQAAHRLGIVLLHQELNLADNLDVAANIYLGREPRRLGFIDKPRLRRDATRLMSRLGLHCSPHAVVRMLPIGQQQLVEIAKALSIDARVLIMDEPTSSLSRRETEQLFEVLRDLRSRGVSIIYISHRLGEVGQLADRVMALRDGQNAGELDRAEITHGRMVRLMVGRDLAQFYTRQAHPPGAPLLELDGLRTAAHPKASLSFQLRAGEIVGLAGLVGAGRSELLQTLFGAARATGGTLRIAGRAARFRGPPEAIAAGIALVPEDRKQQGLILEMMLRHNLSLARLRQESRAGFLNRAAECAVSRHMIEQLDIRAASDRQPVQSLSGGNQQKTVLGKWLATAPRVLLLDEPTRGVDVAAKQEIYKYMDELARRGMALLFASSDMEEILGMADRVLVMHDGRITGELARDELSEEAVMRLATGGGRAPPPTSSALPAVPVLAVLWVLWVLSTLSPLRHAMLLGAA